MFPPQYSPFNAARSFAIRDRAKCPRRRARSFNKGVIKSRVNAVPRDDYRCIILKIQYRISPVMEISDFPYASALRMCTPLRGQVIKVTNFAKYSLPPIVNVAPKVQTAPCACGQARQAALAVKCLRCRANVKYGGRLSAA